MFKLTSHQTSHRTKLHDCHGKCVKAEAKAFVFGFEREAAILGVGYATQMVAGHAYTIVVAIIYLALATRPSVKAAREAKQQTTREYRQQLAVELAGE